MNKIKQGIAIAISIILCLSLSQPVLNGLSNKMPQDTLSSSIEEQPIKQAPGGILIDFDDLPSGTFIFSNYDDVYFTSGYQVLDTTASPYYFPLSSPNVAYTNDENNNITFDNHVSYVSFYVSTVFDYNIEAVAYTTTDLVVESVAIGYNVTHQFIEINAPSGVIHRISLTGDPGFNGYCAIDDLYYLEYVPTPVTTITFEDFDNGIIEDSYPEILYSPGYEQWDFSGYPDFPTQSGVKAAFSNEINNWFVFEKPIMKVGLFVTTAGLGYTFLLTAYTDQNLAIEEISIPEETKNMYIEFHSPLGRIHNISMSGSAGFQHQWIIDTLSFTVLDAPEHNLINFEDLSDATPVGTHYAGIIFTPDFTIWNSSQSSSYPPHSGFNTIYSHEVMPNITFSFPVDYVSFYISVSGDRNIEAHAYSESGILLHQANITDDVENQYIVLRSLLGMIHRITLVGDSGFQSYWTMDDLSYIEHIPADSQLLTFDEVAEGTIIENLYAGIHFAPGYQTINTSLNAFHPPESGDMVIYSPTGDYNITFATPRAYLSFYINAFSDYNVVVRAYNEADFLIQSVDIVPDSIHQVVEIYSFGSFIKRITIEGDTGFENYISIDTLYLEGYKETFEFLLDFEDYPTSMNDYPHVTFSPGFTIWNSVGSPYYPPNSGNSVTYSFELVPTIIFSIPIMYTSFVISTPTNYGIHVLAYTVTDQLIFDVSVEGDSIDKLIEIYSEDSEITKIVITGGPGFNSHWTIDTLYYATNIFTYDLDGDGLPYYDEILIGTDPFDSDSDGDGYSDGEEVSEGTDPLNPNDYPIYTPEFGYISFSLFIPFLMVLGLIFIRRRRK